MTRVKMMAIIPARGGSKGLPRKNLRPLCGLPLIAWTIKAAKECPLIDCVVVTSDDPEILDVANQFGADQLIRRPEELATDEATTSDAVHHVFSQIPLPDNFVLLQPTSPLRSSYILTNCVNLFMSTDAVSVVSVTKSSESPFWTYTMEGGVLNQVVKTGGHFDQRQKLPTTYFLNGAMYVWNTAYFMTHGDLVTSSSVGFEMSNEVSVDIDTFEDFKKATIFFENLANRDDDGL